MKLQDTIERVRAVCRTRRLSRHTEAAYVHWIGRFGRHVAKCGAGLSREEKVRLFLEGLAARSAAATQNQALNAVVFLYRDVLRERLGDLGKWARAKRPKRLPTWLTHEEMMRLLGGLRPFTRLMAEVAYGSGLRLAELLALRVKDVDFVSRLISVRGGKGDKDRVTCLPQSVAFKLRAHLEQCRTMWEADRARGANAIYLPDGLERKFPNGGKEWPWFWVWPGGNESRDPRTGIVRRHHVHEDTLGKALRRAARLCGIHKRVTAHTLRHSFATNLLTNGASITQVQELLGHTSVETTQVYLHCVPKFAETIVSPLDAMSNVVAFVPAGRAELERGVSSLKCQVSS
jgi:integron integrase